MRRRWSEGALRNFRRRLWRRVKASARSGDFDKIALRYYIRLKASPDRDAELKVMANLIACHPSYDLLKK